MAKSWFGNVEEYTGPVPSGGYKCVIEEIEKGKTSEQAQTPGAMRYMAVLRVTEPKKYAGTMVKDYFTIGTEDDIRGRDQETWNSSLGAKKLFRLLKRAGVTARDGDDEEWQDAAQGQEVCAHIMKETDSFGTSNKINGNYFRESDPDFVGVGEALEAPSKSGGGAGNSRSARGGAAEKPQRGAASARAARPPVDDDDEDDAPPTKGRSAPVDDDDDDDEAKTAEAKPAARGNSKLKAAPKGGRKLPADADDDDDED